MNVVYLMVDKDKNIVAIYTDQIIAKKMKKPIEEKLNLELTLEERSVNLDLKMVGLVK